MIRNARRLVCVDANAARLGLSAGLTLADARARHPALVVCEADPAGEAKLLERLADACARYTPLVALDRADGLMLDVSGVAHLFGGEAGLLAEIEARFERQGFGLALGLADAPRAAWALARYSNRRIAPAGLAGKAFVKLFHEMPVAALGLEEADAADMARAGLRRIGDLAMRPRAPIAARFGVEVLAKLDALNGLERDAISPRFAAPDFCAERRFASPIAHVDAVMATLARLADDLVVLLERQAKGARLVELMLYRVDGDVRRIRVGAGRPLNEARAIARLFVERLAGGAEDEIDAGFGVDLMRLSCLVAEPLEPSQREWERAFEAERAAKLADLLDRLSARLGPSRVTRQTLVDAHIPEQAVAAAPAVRGEMRARGEGLGLYLRRRGAEPAAAAVRAARADRDAGGGSRRAAAALPLAPRAARSRRDRGPRTHRRALVAAPRRAHPRLFPRRGRLGAPLLALPRGAVRPRDERAKWFLHGVFA